MEEKRQGIFFKENPLGEVTLEQEINCSIIWMLLMHLINAVVLNERQNTLLLHATNVEALIEQHSLIDISCSVQRFMLAE